jgi:hypothetical protein
MTITSADIKAADYLTLETLRTLIFEELYERRQAALRAAKGAAPR